MRSDPYQERARALAVEAGLDPDARIERQGQKSMPTWCTFRDAARKEHMARESAAASAEIAMIAPQAPQFQNSPLQIFGDHDDATVAQMRNCMAVGNVVAGVVCADGHLGYAQPVGGVIAHERQISISGVGFDIGCGNMAVRLDTPFSAIEGRTGEIIRDVQKVISFGVGRTNDERVEHELFDDSDAWRESDMGEYRHKAVTQLGTVGSGNHYVDLMRDEAGYVWIGVHFGSRGLGHTSATRYLKAAGGKDGMNVPPAVIDMVHNHHNYAWRENHGGRDLWVVRKGATPAFPGQRGFVGGSMGDDAVIIEGVDSPEARASLYSNVHGAGRLFGRKEAKRRFSKEEMDRWLQARGVTLIGADLDESPMAYRRLPEVLAHHAGSIKVLHTLRPFAVAMAGEGEFDPFKD